ncbi:1-deoxy-D-xylulose-5-phosphate reductoisomerase [Buchnera aphidicola (Muscaphis stroyani)]|uniref:1-deoxy-D-xylulose 5-phosphate reductoisomerase n=1 Tax=Buchnera aphidicola (Muscaphis stroyani) TaxID=1241869 RepID=A0A4D6Y5C4_9GAMM|nr:1-deoxy-D-xylulose-5-phosphate reductoisomerase [Buchnera aphidicola]QCI24319.1 1-deoxy-D-xylulose-5-phosphate reductoisomerase [Buchnera aphidicola (Muscaphis stroyani)]
MKKITILGSTGFVGMSALSVIRNNPTLFQVVALVANKNIITMLQQCRFFTPKFVAMRDEKSANILRKKLKFLNIKTQVLSGKKAICHLASLDEIDHVIAAIVGISGLMPILSAIYSSKTILLANKESLITCGHFFMRALSKNNSKIIPIDSEHSAIFQVLPSKIQNSLGKCNLKNYGIKSVILTASGGPFYNSPFSELSSVTPKQACAHPNWVMGKKISVDSATMMNKGLEYAEARWLFNASHSEIEILIHPQSVIHSMVKYCDGSYLAQLSSSDIKISIAYALSWPIRIDSGSSFLNLEKMQNLSFFEPDFNQFPCLKLAIDAFSNGQSAMIVLNAANESAVKAFLNFRISFIKIAEINSDALMSFCFKEPNSIEEVLDIDRKTKILVEKKIASLEF